jgi:hypothetical protein
MASRGRRPEGTPLRNAPTERLPGTSLGGTRTSPHSVGVPASLPTPAADAPIDDHRTWCRFEAELRIVKLGLLDAEVAASLSLSAAHRTSLNDLLAATRSGIGAIDASLAGETDLGALLSQCQRLETEHLVFSLRTPQVQNVIGADTVVTRSRSVKTESGTLAPLIDAAEVVGNPHVTRMRELSAAVVPLADGARAGVTGVSNALVAVTPADWLANRDILTPFQDKNRVARADLETAKAHIAEIRRLLLWVPPDATPPVIFTVIVTPTSLCNLTRQFAQGSAKYKALSASAKRIVDALSATACKHANAITAKLTAKENAKLVAAYKTALGVLQKGGWVTSPQTTLLQGLEDKL